MTRDRIVQTGRCKSVELAVGVYMARGHLYETVQTGKCKSAELAVGALERHVRQGYHQEEYMRSSLAIFVLWYNGIEVG